MSKEEIGEIVPQAYYDCLLMLSAAPRSVAPLSSMELHLFAYLACAISVFQGHPSGDWGYGFTLVGTGRPFSPSIDDAEKIVLSRNLASRDDQGLLNAHQPAARNELELLSRFGFVGDRQIWGRTAVECALALPVGAIRQAMLARPGVSQAVELHQLRALMSADDVARIHRERHEVATLVGQTADLLAPAVAWLTLSLDPEGAIC